MIHNLVTNALKYGTDDAPVLVRSRGMRDGVALEVHNSGAPIAPDVIPDLFKPMRRGARGREIGGIGLGLSIVDQIVRAHDGEVAVQSSLEAGTTFIVSLPRHAAG